MELRTTRRPGVKKTETKNHLGEELPNRRVFDEPRSDAQRRTIPASEAVSPMCGPLLDAIQDVAGRLTELMSIRVGSIVRAA
jgi:hypothetical protein